MIRTRLFNILRSEAGVSAVEFALISPLLFVLTFGIVEFGILLFDKAVITNASREGARAAIVFNRGVELPYISPTETEVETVVTNYANTYLINLGPASTSTLTAADIEMASIDLNGSGVLDSGDDLLVTVRFNYDFLVFPNLSRLIGGDFDGTVDIVGTTRMRME